MNNYEHLIFRGKTMRRRKQDSKKQREKELLKLDRLRNELWEKQRNLGYEKLEEPYQRGYKRYFVVREDVARSKYGHFYEELLPYINTVEYSLNAEFKTRKCRRKKGKKQYTLKRQYLHQIIHYDFNKVPSKFHKHFVERRKKYYRNHYCKYLVFKEAWRYRLVIEPNIITHKRIIDSKLESDIQKLDNYIDKQLLNVKISKAKSTKHNYHYWDYHELKFREKQIPIRKLRQQLYEEKIETKVIKMDSRGCPFSFYLNTYIILHLLHHNRRSTAAAIANSNSAILRIVLVEYINQSNQDTRARAS